MDKRFQVFISSTYTDLREERQAVISALLQLNAIPAGMELFPVADDDAWTLIRRVIDECDYYLLLIGGKYGSVDADGVGFTEREYYYAISCGKPVMAFLHGDPDQIPAGKSEKRDEARAKLERFREKVQASKHVKFWTTPPELAGQVALSYSHFLQAYPAAGWVRADDAASPDTIAELNSLRKQNFEIMAELNRAQGQAPAGTEDLEQGEDNYEVLVTARFRVDGLNVAGLSPHQRYNFEIAPTWDDILSAVGSRLLDEASEQELRSLLVRGLIGIYEYEMDDQAEHWLEGKGHKTDGWVFQEYVGRIGDDQWGTILVQLMALGLITKSSRPRSVRDRQTYWTLTPYGQTRVIKLKAIHRRS
jgi:hypothetical protein